MTDNTDTADMRLLDFGLSKIIGPNETCTEPYGTLVGLLIFIIISRMSLPKFSWKSPIINQ